MVTCRASYWCAHIRGSRSKVSLFRGLGGPRSNDSSVAASTSCAQMSPSRNIIQEKEPGFLGKTTDCRREARKHKKCLKLPAALERKKVPKHQTKPENPRHLKYVNGMKRSVQREPSGQSGNKSGEQNRNVVLGHFPGGPGTKTLHSEWPGLGSIPGQETRSPMLHLSPGTAKSINQSF